MKIFFEVEIPEGMIPPSLKAELVSFIFASGYTNKYTVWVKNGTA